MVKAVERQRTGQVKGYYIEQRILAMSLARG